MKSPEYVATVTRIYRKYIDLALSDKPYTINKNDKQELLQVFNRGMFSSGHFNSTPNKDLVFKDKPNHMGLFLGNVQKYNKNKGYITLKLKETIHIGDKISVETESGSYIISELMENNKNIKEPQIGQTVILGRIKGNIRSGDKVYKISSKVLFNTAKESYKKENRKIPLNCTVTIQKSQPLTIHITSCNDLPPYQDLNITCSLDYMPEEAKNKPLDKETIIRQISKTNSTPYEFENIDINMEKNIYLAKISILNELRRLALEKVQEYALSKIHRNITNPLTKSLDLEKDRILDDMRNFIKTKTKIAERNTPKISLLFNILNTNFDYSKLENIDDIYIPLKLSLIHI